MDQASSTVSQGPPAESSNNNNPTESNPTPTSTFSVEPTSNGGGEPTSAQPSPSEVPSNVSEQTPAPTSSTPAAESPTDTSPTSNSDTASYASATTIQNPSPSPTENNNGGQSTIGPSNQGDTSHTNTGAIAGGVVGGVVGAALIALALFLIWRRRRRLGQAPKSADDFMSQPYDDDWRQGGTSGSGWNQQQQGRIGPTVQQFQPLYSTSNNDIPVNKPNVPIYKPDDPSRTIHSTRRPYPPSPTVPDGDHVVGTLSANPNSSTNAAAGSAAATEPDKPDERNDASPT